MVLGEDIADTFFLKTLEEKSLESHRKAANQKVNEPDKWPLFEICNIKEGDSYIAAIDIDMLIVDGFSLSVLVRDFKSLCRRLELEPISDGFGKYLEAYSIRKSGNRYLQDKQYSAEVASARIQYQQSLEDYNRRVPLAKQGVISKETLEHTKDTLISSKAALNAAIQAYKANKALVMNTPLNRQPQVVEAADATKEAWLALKRTDIKSPVTGYIAQRSVQVGETVSPGQSLMAVVSARQMWVNANFKETQLTDVRIGQSVNIISDLYGENVVFHGRVTGINMGTGNAFSLLPAQNATGNWIKIVQRVPVEVSLDPKELMEHPLRIGLSMTATIDTKNEDIAEMPELASTVTSMPAYTSKALVIDTSPIEKEISNIISHNGQL